MLRRRFITLALPLVAAACGSTRGGGPRMAPGYESGSVSCVPYARQRSGIPLRGDAWEWWGEAAGLYARDRVPSPGAVLVLARTSRLRSGHLSVVTRVVSGREIRVDHSNWAPWGSWSRGMIARDQPVMDVSDAGDWSAVRVWYPRTDTYGNTAYAAYGFIHPRRA
ncbi:MAG TPA: CHAP domain-containing protein [Roseomonas sp.]|jgi:surface antigen